MDLNAGDRGENIGQGVSVHRLNLVGADDGDVLCAAGEGLGGAGGGGDGQVVGLVVEFQELPVAVGFGVGREGYGQGKEA
ncbi:hypothetical protein [Geobacter anodireducens]